jgi:AraC family transcriptional regulator, regulatory protein of adaptative response / methylated-DNA-[protein]-cysteine methyltransferase
MNAERRWRAVMERDSSQDGSFYYGVVTTGVYCRPSCPSRRPLLKNVQFFRAPDEAESAGLRPCRRCRPRDAVRHPLADRMRELCRYIEAHAHEPLTLKTLSEQAHLSPFHLQRNFKSFVGVTPKQYTEAYRLKSLKQKLRDNGSVTNAVYDAGFSSGSRVYERADTRLGMTPRQYRERGHGVEISYAAAPTPLGTLMVGATDRGLCFVQFGEQEAELRARLQREYPSATVSPMPQNRKKQFAQWMRALTLYLQGSQTALELPLDVHGTAFQMKVWNYLQRIPYGDVQSYTEVAKGIGHSTAVRAVARACASNPLALVIPCHRVIRGDGALSGYRWGLDRKRALIERERATRTEAQAKTRRNK